LNKLSRLPLALTHQLFWIRFSEGPGTACSCLRCRTSRFLHVAIFPVLPPAR